MTRDEILEDAIQTEAKAMARAQGFNPDEIVETDECEPMVEDRGDGVPVTELHRPLRPRWAQFEAEARARLVGEPPPAG